MWQSLRLVPVTFAPFQNGHHGRSKVVHLHDQWNESACVRHSGHPYNESVFSATALWPGPSHLHNGSTTPLIMTATRGRHTQMQIDSENGQNIHTRKHINRYKQSLWVWKCTSTIQARPGLFVAWRGQCIIAEQQQKPAHFVWIMWSAFYDACDWFYGKCAFKMRNIRIGVSNPILNEPLSCGVSFLLCY